MHQVKDYQSLGCKQCAEGRVLDFDFSMAMQPIVNVRTGEVFAYEALVRGLKGESAGTVFEHVNPDNLYRFDQTCRVKAIRLAAQLRIPCYLSINFLPNAVYRPELCIRTTLAAAVKYGFPIERIIFEIVESEEIVEHEHLTSIINKYQELGFKTALDDFGGGYANLNLLTRVQTDLIKLDMELIRDIDSDKNRQVIVRHMSEMCRDLGIQLIAEGIESAAELEQLQDYGIELIQGYLLAKPAFESLPPINLPTRQSDAENRVSKSQSSFA